ncbi:MAG: hypothetical protein AAFO59_03860 [Cyanobacteria bacterium J06607_17]
MYFRNSGGDSGICGGRSPLNEPRLWHHGGDSRGRINGTQNWTRLPFDESSFFAGIDSLAIAVGEPVACPFDLAVIEIPKELFEGDSAPCGRLCTKGHYLRCYRLHSPSS